MNSEAWPGTAVGDEGLPVKPSRSYELRTKRLTYCSNIYAFRSARKTKKGSAAKNLKSAPGRLVLESEPSESLAALATLQGGFENMAMTPPPSESASRSSVDSFSSMYAGKSLKTMESMISVKSSSSSNSSGSGRGRKTEVAGRFKFFASDRSQPSEKAKLSGSRVKSEALDKFQGASEKPTIWMKVKHFEEMESRNSKPVEEPLKKTIKPTVIDTSDSSNLSPGSSSSNGSDIFMEFLRTAFQEKSVDSLKPVPMKSENPEAAKKSENPEAAKKSEELEKVEEPLRKQFRDEKIMINFDPFLEMDFEELEEVDEVEELDEPQDLSQKKEPSKTEEQEEPKALDVSSPVMVEEVISFKDPVTVKHRIKLAASVDLEDELPVKAEEPIQLASDSEMPIKLEDLSSLPDASDKPKAVQDDKEEEPQDNKEEESQDNKDEELQDQTQRAVDAEPLITSKTTVNCEEPLTSKADVQSDTQLTAKRETPSEALLSFTKAAAESKEETAKPICSVKSKAALFAEPTIQIKAAVATEASTISHTSIKSKVALFSKSSVKLPNPTYAKPVLNSKTLVKGDHSRKSKHLLTTVASKSSLKSQLATSTKDKNEAGPQAHPKGLVRKKSVKSLKESEKSHKSNDLKKTVGPGPSVYSMSSLSSGNSLPSLNSIESQKSQGSGVTLESQNSKVSTNSIESQNSIVPSLGLQSDDSQDCEAFSEPYCQSLTGLQREPDVAYKNWLSAKRFIMAQEKERRKAEKKELAKQKENRRKLSEQMYAAWLRKKNKEKAEREKKVETTAKPSMRNNVPPISKQEKEARLQIWYLKKRLEEERRRQIDYIQRIKRCTYENRRKELSKEAFARWIAQSVHKPRPVPLNQGILSLRGTVSEIFVNPQPWRGVLSTNL